MGVECTLLDSLASPSLLQRPEDRECDRREREGQLVTDVCTTANQFRNGCVVPCDLHSQCSPEEPKSKRTNRSPAEW